MGEPSFPIYQFSSDVVSTSIGVIVGAAFSLWLYALERKHQANKERLAELANRQVILRHIMLACASNLETAINFKSQMALPLKGDIEQFTPVHLEGSIEEAIVLSTSLKHMFQALQPPPFTPLPSHSDMVFITDEAIMLLGLSVRLSESFSSLKQSIELRNKYLESFALGASTGMNVNAFNYYFTMLTATSNNIIQSVDDAAFFSDILAEQTDNYAKNRFKGIRLVSFELDAEKKVLQPPKDYVRGFRKQFKDFSKDAQAAKKHGRFRWLWPW